MAALDHTIPLDFSLVAGDTFDETFTWSGKNLSAATAKFQIRSGYYDAGAALVSLTQGSGITLGSDGSIRIRLTPSQTATVAPGKYRYALEVTESDGTRTTILSGHFEIRGDVTR